MSVADDNSSVDTGGASQYSEVMDSVAFSVIDDLQRTKKITKEEGDFLRDKYRKLYDSVNYLKMKEDVVNKHLKSSVADSLACSIQLEKVRFEEKEELQKLKKLEDEKDSLEKVVWLTDWRTDWPTDWLTDWL